MSKDPIRLNIGAGDSQIPGFIPIDAKFGHDATRLDYPDNSVDEVYSSHCLEHIHHSKTSMTIREWCRVLKPGGRIRIAIPNYEAVLANVRNDPDKFNSSYLSAWMHGTHDVDTDRHQAFILKSDLETLLRQCGIDNIGPWDGEYEDQAKYNAMSLNIGGYKRETKVPRNPVVAMVLSTPRFGPVDTFKSIADACESIGWKFYHWGGTEWGKGLEQVIQHVIKNDNPDYIFTIDYDSVFDPGDCLKILDFMQNNPDVAAVWPAQTHRHMDLPLGMNPNGAAVGVYDFSGDFTEMWSGHFGSTMIRRQVFDTIPHPWFWSIPDPETGDWNKGSDADITFWKWCFQFGFKIGQINTVQIGHLEWCVKWMTRNGIIWQPIQNYRKNGRPTEAVFNGEYWVNRSKAKINGEQPRQPVSGTVKPEAELSETKKPTTDEVEAFIASGANNGKSRIGNSLNGHAGVSV